MAPPDGERWEGFMAGVTGAKVVAFGVGPRGIIPDKSTLEFPMFGIQGDFREVPFSACAAKNTLDRDTSCYLCVDGEPESLFCTSYPEDEPGRPVMFFDLA